MINQIIVLVIMAFAAYGFFIFHIDYGAVRWVCFVEIIKEGSSDENNG